MFRTSICPSSGVQVVYCCMRCSALGVVAVVLCTVCEFIFANIFNITDSMYVLILIYRLIANIFHKIS